MCSTRRALPYCDKASGGPLTRHADRHAVVLALRARISAAAAVGLPPSQSSIEPSQVYEWIRTHVPDNADAVFIGGGSLRAIAAIHALEHGLARPVLSANQVLFWQALRLARIHEAIARCGQIFGLALPQHASLPLRGGACRATVRAGRSERCGALLPEPCPGT